MLAPVAAALIQMAISRSREYLADDTGAHLCGRPQDLAAALQSLGMYSGRIPLQHGNPSTGQMFIVRPAFSVGSGVSNLFSTHPPIEERISRLQAMARHR
jgi:heat shock protein HtpX